MFLHANQITHRDIKPENIIIKEDNGKKIAKICDFGTSSGENMMYSGIGSPSFLDP